MADDAILARDWTFEVDEAGGVNYKTIGGINTFTLGSVKNDADTTRFSSNGWMRHLPASRGVTLTLDGMYEEDVSTGARDAGQAAVETLAGYIGTTGIGTFRVTSPGGNIKTFSGSVKLNDIGGGNDDPTSWGCEITVDGEVTES